MSAQDLLIFDMDGVLVDVGESYRETIRRTVEHFTGAATPHDRIQEFKNRGGWNDDWALSVQLIRDAGVDASYDSVVTQFQKYFRGENGRGGLIEREKWIGQAGLFDRLASAYRLAVFTGRLHEEAEVTLQRFAAGVFDPVVGTDDVAAGKPAPDGILKILSLVEARRVFSIGDTVDDAGSARAAGVPFIGITSEGTPRREESVRVLMECGAVAVLSSINELERELSRQ